MRMQTYSGNKDEFGVRVGNGASEKYESTTKFVEPAFDFSPKKETKKAAPAPSEQDLKVAKAKAILAGNSKKRYKKSYKTSPRRSASYDAPHWSLLDNPAVDNHSGWSNPVAGLGRDLTVSQVRDMRVMPNQRRDWTDWRGTAKKAK
jgi:hypothetical protein